MFGIWLSGCNSPPAPSYHDQSTSTPIRTLYDQAETEASVSLSKARELIEAGIERAYAEQRIGLVVQGYFLFADLCRAKGRSPNDQRLAVNYYLKAADLCEERSNAPCAARAHYHAGLGYLFFKDHEQAIGYLLKALARYEMLNDSVGMLRSRLRLSDAFWGNGTILTSKDYAGTAEQLARAMKDDSALTYSLILQGDFFREEKDYDQAERYYEQAFDLFQGSKDPKLMLTVLLRLAEVETLRGELTAAKAHLAQASDMTIANDLLSGRAEVLGLQADQAMALGNYGDARALLDSSMTLAKRHNLTDLLLRNQQRYITYLLQTNQPEKLRTNWDQYNRLRDSLEQLEQRDLTQRLNAQFEVQKQNYRIGLLQEQRKTQAAELENQRYQIQFAIAIGLFLLLLAGILYQQYRSKRRVNQQLEWLVARRTEELRFANRDLQEVNKELDTFAYRTAHDIRGPVARLLGLCQLVLHDDRDGDQTRYLELIHQEAIQMDFMLHRFLEVNNIKHHQCQPEPINLAQEIEAVKREMKEVEGYDTVAIHADLPPNLELVTDRALLHIILKNLIENAITYQRQDGEAAIIDIQAQAQDGEVEVQVIDNGIGIDPEVAPRLFEMFYRGTTASKGLGLGLYATQLAAQALSATVSHQSRQREGTAFVVRLPKDYPSRVRESA